MKFGNQNFILSGSVIKNGLILCLDATSSFVSSSYGWSGDRINWYSVVGSSPVLYNSPTYTSSFGGNVLFDGYTQYGVFNNSTALNNMTLGDFFIGIWFKTLDTEADMLSNGIGSAGNYLLMSYQTKLRGHLWTNGSVAVVDSNKVVNDNNWHFGCQVVTGSTLQLYVDGVYDNSTSIGGTRGVVNSVSYLASRGGVASSNISGAIAQVLVYNRALSSSEIASLYSGSKGRFGL